MKYLRLAIKPVCYAIALGELVTFLGCATDKTTFLNYGDRGPPNVMTAPEVSDGLAINYANSIEIIMRCHATGNRITREVSATAQVGLAAFGGLGAALHWSTTTLTILGLGSAAIPQLQKIFDAGGRAEAYNQAAEMIQDGVLAYYAQNPHPSAIEFTPNGLTLVKKVASAINLVNDTITGHLPSQGDMQKAVEAMSPEGTTVQNPKAPPVNARVQTLKTVVINKPVPVGPNRPDNIQPVVASAGEILRSLSKDQAQKALNELKPDASASPNPQEEIAAMLIDTTTMEQAVKILTALQHAK